jgi:hypothetical protein
LKRGVDARKEGLIWIVKVLWLLDEEVHVAHMPPFIDSDCMKYLLEYAKSDMKRYELHLALKDLRLRAKKERITSVFKLKMNNNRVAPELNSLTINRENSPGR